MSNGAAMCISNGQVIPAMQACPVSVAVQTNCVHGSAGSSTFILQRSLPSNIT